MTMHPLRAWWAGAAAGVLALAACGKAPPAIDVSQAQAQFAAGQAVLIDVREPDEHAAVRAPGATLIPLGQLAQRLGELPQDKATPVLVVCRSGSRSAAATDLLRQAGYGGTLNVSGGMNAWEQAGLPVLRGAGGGR